MTVLTQILHVLDILLCIGTIVIGVVLLVMWIINVLDKPQ